MKKLFTFLVVATFLGVSLTSCHGVRPDADEESVLVYKPWFFGHGGVDKNPVEAGLTWCVWSTSSETFKITPQQYEEGFDNIMTSDNNPVDFNTYIRIEIIAGETPVLYENFGIKWYENNIREPFRAMTRNKARAEKMFALTTDRSLTDSLSSVVKDEMRTYISNIKRKDGGKGMPVRVVSVTFGKVVPPDEVLAETNKTAAEKQRVKTQEARTLAENSREAAEKAKAKADKAYKAEFNMTTGEWLVLEELGVRRYGLDVRKLEIDMVKGKENVTIILNSGSNSAVPTVPLR